MVFSVFLVILVGCGTGRHCIKIGGDWEGAKGEFEYCYEAKASSEAGRPVLENSAGEKLVGLFEKDLLKINSLIPDEGEKIEAKEFQGNLVRIILRKIEKK